MYLENLKEKIFKKDLGIGETFSAALDLFKIILKENKLLAFLQFILIFIPIISFYLGYFWIVMLAVSGYAQLIPVFILLGFGLMLAFTIVNNYFKKNCIKSGRKGRQIFNRRNFYKVSCDIWNRRWFKDNFICAGKYPFHRTFFSPFSEHSYNNCLYMGLALLLWRILYS